MRKKYVLPRLGIPSLLLGVLAYATFVARFNCLFPADTLRLKRCAAPVFSITDACCCVPTARPRPASTRHPYVSYQS